MVQGGAETRCSGFRLTFRCSRTFGAKHPSERVSSPRTDHVPGRSIGKPGVGYSAVWSPSSRAISEMIPASCGCWIRVRITSCSIPGFVSLIRRYSAPLLDGRQHLQADLYIPGGSLSQTPPAHRICRRPYLHIMSTIVRTYSTRSGTETGDFPERPISTFPTLLLAIQGPSRLIRNHIWEYSIRGIS